MTEVRAPGHEFNYSEFEEIHDALDEVINIPYHPGDTLAEMEETIIRVAAQRPAPRPRQGRAASPT